MSNIKIWHNSKCSKSRAALEFLEQKSIELNKTIEIIDYLDNTPNLENIKEVLILLNYKAKDLMRKKEDLYINLEINEINDENELIKLMIKNPSLIERPVVIYNNKAAIARPLENVKELF